MANSIVSILQKKIKLREARIGIIGMGYVGLPLAIAFCEEGFEVYGFDSDAKKIDKLREGKSYISHLTAISFFKFVKSDKLKVRSSFEQMGLCDVILVCVPTPLTPNKEPDLSFIESACDTMYRYLRRGQLIILESTTYPGTTREVVYPRLQRDHELRLGEDYFIGYSPEREDPGNEHFNLKNTPKIVAGFTEDCKTLTESLYKAIVETTVPVSTLEIAETVKLLENIYRSVNIAFVNEFKIACQKMNIDIWEVIRAAKTKPYGFQAFYPGAGQGGHCTPLDPIYFSWRAKQFDAFTRFIELSGETNVLVPQYVVQRIQHALNTKAKAVKGSRILVLGVAYKKDINDTRESPALKIIDMLHKLEGQVHYSDPFVPKLSGLVSEKITPDVLRAMDCVVIITDHTGVDYNMVAEYANLVVDTRGVIPAFNSKVTFA